MKDSENTVMVVDDDEVFLEELSEALALSGYNMITVSDPTEVVALASGLKPKLILLDIKMPGKTGIEIAREMSNLPEFSDIPIIAMSGHFQDEDRLRSEVRRIKKLIKKPFNLTDLLKIIHETLRRVPA